MFRKEKKKESLWTLHSPTKMLSIKGWCERVDAERACVRVRERTTECQCLSLVVQLHLCNSHLHQHICICKKRKTLIVLPKIFVYACTCIVSYHLHFNLFEETLVICSVLNRASYCTISQSHCSKIIYRETRCCGQQFLLKAQRRVGSDPDRCTCTFNPNNVFTRWKEKIP